MGNKVTMNKEVTIKQKYVDGIYTVTATHKSAYNTKTVSNSTDDMTQVAECYNDVLEQIEKIHNVPAEDYALSLYVNEFNGGVTALLLDNGKVVEEAQCGEEGKTVLERIAIAVKTVYSALALSQIQ